MKPSTLTRLIPIPIVLAFAGCMVGGDERTNYGTSLKAITKTKWLSCWVRPTTETGDPFFDVDALQCSAAVGEGPMSPSLISFRSPGEGTWVSNGRIDKPGTIHIGRLQRSGYPHTVDVHVLTDSRELATMADMRQGLLMSFTIERPGQYTIDKPLVIEQPIDIWPIEVTVESEVFSMSLQDYSVPLPAGVKLSDGYMKTLDHIDLHHSRFDVLFKGQTKTFYVAVPRGARRPLAGSARLARRSEDRVKVELDGPGAYVATLDAVKRKPGSSTGTGTSTQMLDSCPGSWGSDSLCDRCLAADPACNVNGITGCEAQWRGDSICDECLGDDPDCETGAECPASWRGDGVCDACLGDDPDCVIEECSPYWRDDGVCDPCLGPADGDDCTGMTCPVAWRGDGTCDECLGDDPDCENVDCPSSWNGDGICDECLGDDVDCAGSACPAEWRDDGICDECLGDDPDCEPACPMEWYGDGLCDECLINDPDCEDPSCPWSWYSDGWCDPCLGDDPDCEA